MTNMRPRFCAAWVIFIWLLVPARSFADELCVDPAHSEFKIHVESGGFFGAFAHDHLVAAKSIKGCANIDWGKLDQSSLELTFSAADVKVLDPEHTKDRPKVQHTMETEVLRVQQFPEILFKSQRVRMKSASSEAVKRHSVIIDGALTIRGKTQNISLPVIIEQLDSSAKATGRYTLKQSSFGIDPIKIMGGTVKVKDEVEIEFEISLKQPGK